MCGERPGRQRVYKKMDGYPCPAGSQDRGCVIRGGTPAAAGVTILPYFACHTSRWLVDWNGLYRITICGTMSQKN